MNKVAIVGFEIEGQSAYRYYKKQGASITIFDERPKENVPADAEVRIGKDSFADLTGFDIVVRSPGIRPDRVKTDGELTSLTKEFFKKCPTPIIGVTGSKGKGTTSTLIYQMLKAAGKKAFLLGNIGTPALDVLDEITPGAIVVYELSSFQLWDMAQSPHIAVVLMVEPEHQDVHTSVDEYVSAKGNIAAFQTHDDLTIYLPTNELTKQVALRGEGKKIPYTTEPGAHVEDDVIVMEGERIVPIAEIALPGQHNADNACAAITAVWQYMHDTEAMARVLRSFSGLEHRLKLVGEVAGVKYYDDSIATTPSSAIAALRSFRQPKVLILGGSDKGADFTELGKVIAGSNVKRTILIGLMREKLQRALAAAGYTDIELFDERSTMQQIVQKAHEITAPGDAVILSPACASFDMFKNYKDRGDKFIAAVERLKARI